ncbi:MAG: hypothetical protein WBA96_07125, partial [Chitinophagaceae bacterium]
FVVFLLSFNTIQKGVSIVFRNDTQQDFKILEVNIRGEKFTFNLIYITYYQTNVWTKQRIYHYWRHNNSDFVNKR